MVAASQLAAGMTIAVMKKVFRIDSVVKVTVPKGPPFIKVKGRDLATGEMVEKSFKPTQEVEEVSLQERRLEFLYPEDGSFVFLDISTLDQVSVIKDVVGEKEHYLKEGVEVKASLCGDAVLSIELPQFLELMISSVETKEEGGRLGTSIRVARLETGAELEVPPFIEAGDVIKVDTKLQEYIQRV